MTESVILNVELLNTRTRIYAVLCVCLYSFCMLLWYTVCCLCVCVVNPEICHHLASYTVYLFTSVCFIQFKNETTIQAPIKKHISTIFFLHLEQIRPWKTTSQQKLKISRSPNCMAANGDISASKNSLTAQHACSEYICILFS